MYNGGVKGTAGPVRVALSGKMRSGKDTAARRMVERHGFVRFAFADKMRQLASELFGADGGEKNRALLVELGRSMTAIDRRVWVRYVLDRIPATADVVISDLRFGYELAELKESGFRLVRVNIMPVKQIERIMATDPDMDRSLLGDISETALDNWRGWDWFLDGGRPMDLFMADVDTMVLAFGRPD